MPIWNASDPDGKSLRPATGGVSPFPRSEKGADAAFSCHSSTLGGHHARAMRDEGAGGRRGVNHVPPAILRLETTLLRVQETEYFDERIAQTDMGATICARAVSFSRFSHLHSIGLLRNQINRFQGSRKRSSRFRRSSFHHRSTSSVDSIGTACWQAMATITGHRRRQYATQAGTDWPVAPPQT
jgi:hypothetical protein